jgi:hypothetical protein
MAKEDEEYCGSKLEEEEEEEELSLQRDDTHEEEEALYWRRDDTHEEPSAASPDTVICRSPEFDYGQSDAVSEEEEEMPSADEIDPLQREEEEGVLTELDLSKRAMEGGAEMKQICSSGFNKNSDKYRGVCKMFRTAW